MKHLVLVLLALSCHMCMAADELQDGQLLSGEDFTKLSEIRVRTINLPLNTKCNLYATTLQEIRSTEQVDKLALFADAISSLKQKKLPFKNPSAVLKELRLCHLNYNDEPTETTTANDSGNSDDLKRKLEGLQQETAQDKAQIIKLKQQLDDERSSSGKMQDLERQIHETREELTKSRNELSARAADSSYANTERDTLKRQLEIFGREAASDKAQMAKLKQQLNDEKLTSGKVHELKMQLDEAQEELAKSKSELSARTTDNSNASSERDALRRQLSNVGQEAARDKSQLIDLRRQLEEVKSELDKLSNALKSKETSLNSTIAQKDSEIEQLKVDLRNSKLKLDQQAVELRRVAENARLEVEAKLRSEMDQLKSERDSQLKELELVKARLQTSGTTQEPLLTSRIDELEILNNNLEPMPHQPCIRYMLLMQQSRQITASQVSFIAQLDTKIFNSVDLNIDNTMQERVLDVHKALSENNNPVHRQIADMILSCSGLERQQQERQQQQQQRQHRCNNPYCRHNQQMFFPHPMNQQYTFYK